MQCFRHRNGGAPRNVRVQRHPLGVPSARHKTRVNALMTRHASRLARRLASHDAGRSPLGAPPWRFWAPGPRFRLLRRPPSYNGGQVPSGSVQRAPRTQVVVPGGRGPCLPRRAVTSRRRRTPRLAPHSGSSLGHALNERGCNLPSTDTVRSQQKYSNCSYTARNGYGPLFDMQLLNWLLRAAFITETRTPPLHSPGGENLRADSIRPMLLGHPLA